MSIESRDINFDNYNSEDDGLVFYSSDQRHFIDVIPDKLIEKMFPIEEKSNFGATVLNSAISMAAYKMGITKINPVKSPASYETDYSRLRWYTGAGVRPEIRRNTFYPQGRKYFKKTAITSFFETKNK